MKRNAQAIALAACMLVTATVSAQERVVQVDLKYAARSGDKAQATPNFSPAGTRVALVDVPPGTALPPGATLPARRGVIKVGSGEQSWIAVLSAADVAHPKDLC